MRRLWIKLGLPIVPVVVVTIACSRVERQPDLTTTTPASQPVNAALPIVLAPEPTPTAPPLPTATATLIAFPTPLASPTATSEPLPGNAVVNGSFEDGWSDLPPAPGYLINQQPNGWALSWLDIGQPLWDDPNATAQGIPESLHKLADQLPPDEQAGGPQALILDGTTTYKMFHFGAPFGSQLYQVVDNLPPGSTWRFTVPVQVHTHDDNDPWAAESGAWALTSATQSGGWVPAGETGDRSWFYHNVEFSVPSDGRVELLIRVKSKWFRSKDFFIDGVELRQLASAQPAPYARRAVLDGNHVTWGPRAWDEIPAKEIVTP